MLKKFEFKLNKWLYYNMDFHSIKSIKTRLHNLKFKKDIKKDYYKSYPSIKVYREIVELISQIKYLESKLV